MSAGIGGPVEIGAREIYDQVVAVGKVVDKLDAKLDGHSNHLDDHDDRIDDHEQRLRVIERSRWPLSPATLVSGGLGLAALALEILPKLAK